MRRTLLITNDFPPRTGGIQSYVHELAIRLPKGSLAVYAPRWPGDADFDAAQPFPVYRHPGSLMLPVRSVARRAVELVTSRGIDSVWFGAAAPLALLTPALRRHGVRRVVASTHGHEVGWAMLPGSRQLLRRIGENVDVTTFVSRYARQRIASALGPRAALEYLPAGVDTGVYRPDPVARARIRARYQLGTRPVVVCISRLVARKGQDMLIAALPQVLAGHPDAVAFIVGGGPDQGRLRNLAERHGVTRAVCFTGRVPAEDLAGYYAAGDVFAMPCRTRAGGLDVEGLGIVYLEASAAGLPVIAGDSGGAPEAVLPGRTGAVVPGRDVKSLADAISRLLGDAGLRERWGAAGRAWVAQRWNWQASAGRLRELLVG